MLYGRFLMYCVYISKHYLAYNNLIFQNCHSTHVHDLLINWVLKKVPINNTHHLHQHSEQCDHIRFSTIMWIYPDFLTVCPLTHEVQHPEPHKLGPPPEKPYNRYCCDILYTLITVNIESMKTHLWHYIWLKGLLKREDEEPKTFILFLMIFQVMNLVCFVKPRPSALPKWF